MKLFLFILFGMSSCFFIILIFSLMKVASRADEAAERMFKIMSSASLDKIEADTTLQTQYDPLSAPKHKVSVRRL